MIVVAPGKLVLLGEYAVLDGAPAVVAAVDRGVRCTVAPGDGLQVVTPTGDDRFARAALEAVGAPPGRYTFADERAAPLPGGDKPGLGGSAAATVAAVLAGHLAAGRDVGRRERLEQALRVHRAVQGSGSGVDVAASTWGGVIRWVTGAEPEALPPPGAALAVVWSGASARTGPRVAQYLACPAREAFVARSREAVARFASEPVAAVRDAWAALVAMAEAADLAYRTPGIDALVALAAEHGGAAKPSGAGGGDVVIALFDAPAPRDRFARRATEAGYAVLETGIAPAAARVG
ncbi:MAG: hypothetical protein R3F59_32995 [Myxococcota bacterium]